MDIFICGRRTAKLTKVQLELPQEIIEAYKKKAKGLEYTPKQIMENVLRNFIEGTAKVSP